MNRCLLPSDGRSPVNCRPGELSPFNCRAIKCRPMKCRLTSGRIQVETPCKQMYSACDVGLFLGDVLQLDGYEL